jgi:hypothetical protein
MNQITENELLIKNNCNFHEPSVDVIEYSYHFYERGDFYSTIYRPLGEARFFDL